MRVDIRIPKEASNAEQAAEYVRDSMCDKFGGYTEYQATGGWRNPETRELVEEPVIVVESYTDSEVAERFMEHIAREVAWRTKEDSVMYVISGNAHFFEGF